MKKILVLFSFLILAACDKSDSDSGGMADDTLPGTNVPSSFVGTYTGVLNVTASAAGITRSDSFPITVTVNNDATITITGDSPEETSTTGLQNDGSFVGNLPVNEDDCSGSVDYTGRVDGTNVSGTVSGSGDCQVGGLDVSVSLTGDFSAAR